MKCTMQISNVAQGVKRRVRERDQGKTYMSCFTTGTRQASPTLIFPIPPKYFTPPHSILMLPLSLQHFHTSKSFHGSSGASWNGFQWEDLSARLS